MDSTILFVLSVTLTPAFGSPVGTIPDSSVTGSGTIETEPGYVPNPSGRGTIGLLLTAVITLTLCCYTSIHLNIAPEKYYCAFIPNTFVYKVNWVFLTLCGPEYVVIKAWDQFVNAVWLREELRNIHEQATKNL